MKADIIREALPGDLDDILEIENDSFDPVQRESGRVFQDRLETFPAGFVILEEDGKAAGYLCSELWNLRAAPAPSDFALGHSARERHNPEGRTLYISSYGIRTAYRGRGLGTALFRGFLDYARASLPFEDILLLASETWIHALSIYRAEGFRDAGRVPSFFRHSDGSRADGLLLRRSRDG